MRKQMYAGLLLLILHCAASAQSAQQNLLSVNGQVLDDKGHPVSGVRLNAIPDGSLRGRMPMGLTDAAGRFTIEVHQTGWFTLTIAKEVAGYATSFNPFYYPTVDPSARVLVEEGKPAPSTTLRFAPRAGKVSALVVDAETNRPVEEVSATLCRVEAPKYCHSLSARFPGGRFQALAPSVPFTLLISADGYKDWYPAAGADRQAEIIQVASGATKGFSVSLQKSSGGVYYAANFPTLEAPRPVSPLDGAVLSYSFPRETKLVWSPVAGAASYTVEVEFCQPGGEGGRECKDPYPLEWHQSPPQSGLEETSYEFPFPGGQPGRWRVWAVDALGRAGAKSAWTNFVYAQ